MLITFDTFEATAGLSRQSAKLSLGRDSRITEQAEGSWENEKTDWQKAVMKRKEKEAPTSRYTEGWGGRDCTLLG